MASTSEKLRQRRLDRMRLGQAVCDFVVLPSDPEVRIAIVPLTEAEYLQALSAVAALELSDNLAGVTVKDRVQTQEILVRAIREPEDLINRVFGDIGEMMDEITVIDVDFIIDAYNEMVEKSSPSLDGIPPEEMEELKKALQAMDWNALTGRAWYAAKRFLSTVMPTPLLDNGFGSTLTNSSTTTKE